ncbi:10238_t:CDS:1, partial [Acaulospora morrowiae]
NVHHEAKLQGQCNMRVISKVTGILWRNASAEEKEMYEELANRVSIVYAQRYHGEEPHHYYHQNMPDPYLPYHIVPQHLNRLSTSFQPSYHTMIHEYDFNGDH